MRRKRKREQAAQDQAASEAAAAAPDGRRTVSVPMAPGPAAGTPPSAAIAAPSPVPTVPDRVDALTEAIGGELGRLRGEMRGRDADLVQALQQVAASYDRVAARLDDERRVQALLAEALVRIDRRLASIEGRQVEGRQVEGRQVEGPTPPDDQPPRPQRVIGGSIAPRQDIPRLDR